MTRPGRGAWRGQLWPKNEWEKDRVIFWLKLLAATIIAALVVILIYFYPAVWGKGQW